MLALRSMAIDLDDVRARLSDMSHLTNKQLHSECRKWNLYCLLYSGIYRG